ncbi:MAG: hypothetical protein AAF899_17065 [Pseudomonadota bacterium]
MTNRNSDIRDMAALTQRQRDAAARRARDLRSAEAVRLAGIARDGIAAALSALVAVLHRPSSATGRG